MGRAFRDVVDETVEREAGHMWSVAQDIFEHPEIRFEEERTADVLRGELAAGGLEVSLPTEKVPTSFQGAHKTGEGPVIAILCEYDALPNIGHACGHPIIATAGVLAGIACAHAMDECGIQGEVRVIGTPAEEDGGGKIAMLDEGCFEGVDAALICHPTTKMTRVAGACCSSKSLTVIFRGRSAQSESHPDQGINALDAVTLTQAGIGLCRQQLPDDVHIASVVSDIAHDIISIPDHATMEFCVSTTGGDAHLSRGVETVRRVAEGAAHACACELEVAEQTEALYLGRLPNETIGAVMREEVRAIGEPCQDGLPIDQGGEDFGNVSRVVPGEQLFGSLLLERKVSGHTKEFLELARGEAGKHCMRMCAMAMARTALVLMGDPEKVAAAKAEMHKRLAAGE